MRLLAAVSTTVADPPGNITGDEAALILVLLGLGVMAMLLVVLALSGNK